MNARAVLLQRVPLVELLWTLVAGEVHVLRVDVADMSRPP